MRINDFINELVEEIQKTTNLSAVPMETEKVNGVVYQGITLKRDSNLAAPVFYLNEMFERYKAGDMTIEEISAELVRQYETLPMPNIPDINGMFMADNLIERVKVRLLNSEVNMEMIKSKKLIYHLVENTDLVCTFYVEVSTDNCSAGTIALSQSLFERYLPNIANADELFEVIVNRESDDFICMESVVDVLSKMMTATGRELPPIADTEESMYVLSNKSKTYGASAILTKQGRKLILEKFPEGQVVVLPSSIHETLIIRKPADMDYSELKNIVLQVNKYELAQEDILSDCVYTFDANTGRLETEC